MTALLLVLAAMGGYVLAIVLGVITNDVDRGLPRFGVWLARFAERRLPEDARPFYGWVAEAEAAARQVVAHDRSRLRFVWQQLGVALVAVTITGRREYKAQPGRRSRLRGLVDLGMDLRWSARGMVPAAVMVLLTPGFMWMARSALTGISLFMGGMGAGVLSGIIGVYAIPRFRRIRRERRLYRGE